MDNLNRLWVTPSGPGRGPTWRGKALRALVLGRTLVALGANVDVASGGQPFNLTFGRERLLIRKRLGRAPGLLGHLMWRRPDDECSAAPSHRDALLVGI